jgi:hypothetical protein
MCTQQHWHLLHQLLLLVPLAFLLLLLLLLLLLAAAAVCRRLGWGFVSWAAVQQA